MQTVSHGHSAHKPGPPGALATFLFRRYSEKDLPTSVIVLKLEGGSMYVHTHTHARTRTGRERDRLYQHNKNLKSSMGTTLPSSYGGPNQKSLNPYQWVKDRSQASNRPGSSEQLIPSLAAGPEGKNPPALEKSPTSKYWPESQLPLQLLSLANAGPPSCLIQDQFL